ncbi:hypothetical protein GALMADRAFT_147018 [Galerina marginata CBS 339.88]|uniref:Uncharacterized protein n=1 Tax=Galerina marginata (strain CBS 339.88) TaxID=685588 RepID=A0A067S9B3_GALM3|nr:hypothetical protein GALMADRAFT_147018 [Galerina marginata CBS 339.88]
MGREIVAAVDHWGFSHGHSPLSPFTIPPPAFLSSGMPEASTSTSTSTSGPLRPPPHFSILIQNPKHLHRHSSPTSNYPVHPTVSIKSPLTARLGFNNPPSKLAKVDRLQVQKLQAEHHFAIARTGRLQQAAVERQALSQLQELQVLINAAEAGATHASLEAQDAINLAKATRDSLAAEEECVKLELELCEARLTALRDEAEIAKTRVLEANFQIGHLLSQINLQRQQPLCPPSNLITEFLDRQSSGSRYLQPVLPYSFDMKANEPSDESDSSESDDDAEYVDAEPGEWADDLP